MTVILDWLAEHTVVRARDRGLRLVSREIASETITIHIAMNVAMIPDVPMVRVSPGIDRFRPPGSEVVPVDPISLPPRAVPTKGHLKVVEVGTTTWRPSS